MSQHHDDALVKTYVMWLIKQYVIKDPTLEGGKSPPGEVTLRFRINRYLLGREWKRTGFQGNLTEWTKMLKLE